MLFGESLKELTTAALKVEERELKRVLEIFAGPDWQDEDKLYTIQAHERKLAAVQDELARRRR